MSCDALWTWSVSQGGFWPWSISQNTSLPSLRSMPRDAQWPWSASCDVISRFFLCHVMLLGLKIFHVTFHGCYLFQELLPDLKCVTCCSLGLIYVTYCDLALFYVKCCLLPLSCIPHSFLALDLYRNSLNISHLSLELSKKNWWLESARDIVASERLRQTDEMIGIGCRI